MNNYIWALVLIAAVWAAHWGAEHLAKPLKKIRKQKGFSLAAGGALIGLAAASPEIGINISSAATGVGEIGLGAMLGSNVIAIPLMVTTAYVASRHLKKKNKDKQHKKHLQEHLLRVKPAAVKVQAIPYLVVIAVVAALTIPEVWRGLQPMDGWIMLFLYFLYLGQALYRGKKKAERVQWQKREILLAVAGLAVLAMGAYFTVRATEQLVFAMGISKLVGGLFITAPVAALPEVFATWSVVKSGQITSGVTSVIGDHVVTLTVALFPLAFVGIPVNNLVLYITVLIFMTIVALLFAIFIHWGSHGAAEKHGFKKWQIGVFLGCLVLYVTTVFFGVLDIQV